MAIGLASSQQLKELNTYVDDEIANFFLCQTLMYLVLGADNQTIGKSTVPWLCLSVV